MIELSEKDFGDWKARAEQAAERIKTRHQSEWRENNSALATKPLKVSADDDLVVVNKDLPRVKQKLAQLFYQVPEVQLKPRQDAYGDAAAVFQPVLNFYLTKRIKSNVMMREVLTDVMGVAGIGVSKLGYELVTEDVEMPLTALNSLPPVPGMGMPPPPQPWMVPGFSLPTMGASQPGMGMPAPAAPPPPAPAPVAPAAPAMPLPGQPAPMPGAPIVPPPAPGAPAPGAPPAPGAAPAPPTITIPRTVHEAYFWNRVSPAKFLFPDDFTGSDFDEASWLGFEFRISVDDAKRKYKNIPDDFSGSTTRDENLVTTPEDKSSGGTSGPDMVRGWEIWYKAYHFDPTVNNPLQQRVLVILEGLDTPARHDDSPYQRIDQTTGKLIGMRRFPVRVLTLTYIPDEAIPPADSTVSRPQVRELWRARTQMLNQRQKSMPWRWADKSRLDAQTIEAIEAGEPQDIILTDGNGEQVIGEVARANYPSENFEFDRVIEQDIAEQWAMGANQMGQATPGDTTKAEVQVMQGNASTRLDYERTLVLQYWLAGVEEIASLIQMFAEDQDYIEVVGQDGDTRIKAWDKTTVAGEFVFDIKPDSALRIDAAQDRADAIHLYQMMANDPFVNRYKLVEAVLRRHNLDPTHILQQPMPKQPPEPNISYRFSGTDFLTPALPIILQILAKGGIQIDPTMAQQVMTQSALAAQALPHMPLANHQPAETPPPSTAHPGPAQQVSPLSKHQFTQGGL